jgi:hypothetical protein
VQFGFIARASSRKVVVQFGGEIESEKGTTWGWSGSNFDRKRIDLLSKSCSHGSEDEIEVSWMIFTRKPL